MNHSAANGSKGTPFTAIPNIQPELSFVTSSLIFGFRVMESECFCLVIACGFPQFGKRPTRCVGTPLDLIILRPFSTFMLTKFSNGGLKLAGTRSMGRDWIAVCLRAGGGPSSADSAVSASKNHDIKKNKGVTFNFYPDVLMVEFPCDDLPRGKR